MHYTIVHIGDNAFKPTKKYAIRMSFHWTSCDYFRSTVVIISNVSVTFPFEKR